MTTALRPGATDDDLLRHAMRRAQQSGLVATTTDHHQWRVGKHQVLVVLLRSRRVRFVCDCTHELAAPCLHIGAVVNAIGQDLNEHDA